jgi:hypothetical protein
MQFNPEAHQSSWLTTCTPEPINTAESTHTPEHTAG